jgi:hypothetical protein
MSSRLFRTVARWSVGVFVTLGVLNACGPSRTPTAHSVGPTPLTPSLVVATATPSDPTEELFEEKPVAATPVAARRRDPRAFRVVHVFVALCDNKHQGIVPVPAVVGNGQDPEHNLYWGASFGVKTFFQRSPNWEEVAGAAQPPNAGVLRRAVFKTRNGAAPVYVVADAYDGASMKEALAHFLDAAAGEDEDDVEAGGERLQAGGLADLVAFVGHNGLMDMNLSDVSSKEWSAAAGDRPASAVVLACLSHRYFAAPLAAIGCPPLITTSSLMAPEAYSLDAILRSWAAGDPPSVTRKRAGDAYARYQRITAPAGRGVFVAGP